MHVTDSLLVLTYIRELVAELKRLRTEVELSATTRGCEFCECERCGSPER